MFRPVLFDVVSITYCIVHVCLGCLLAGFFPVTIEALPEGTCINARVPVFQASPRERNSWMFALAILGIELDVRS